MCGIVGVVQKRGEVAPFLHQALKRLEYRGYDSVGLTTIYEGKLHTKKDKGKIDEVHKRLNLDDLPGRMGIGHTRWATHGVPSLLNAHPHFDCDNRVAVVHNGVIDNFMKLRKELKKNHKFKSETDTEVIPHMIEDLLEQGYDLKEAVAQVTTRINGTYAIVAMRVDEPDRIVCTRDGNPLVIGKGKDASYVSSDIPAFLPMTRDMILLLDGEIAIITPEEIKLEKLSDGSEVERDAVKISWTADQAEKAGFPHFMLKEIHEQPDAVRNTLRIRKETIEKAGEMIVNSERIYVIAMGTSGHAGMACKHMFASMSEIVPVFELASDFEDTIYDTLSEDDLVLAITQSGETTDTVSAAKYAKKFGSTVIAVTNVVGSSITRVADHTIITQAGPEIGVAATKTFMVQLTALAQIAIELGRFSGSSEKLIERKERSLEKIPDVISTVIATEEEKARSIAGVYYDAPSLLFLGRGISIATAREGALKLKEIAYNHAEAYSAGESKHGPIALVEEGYPVIFVAPKDQTRERLVGNIMEMKARGASIISVIEKGDEELKDLSDHVFQVPQGIEPEFSVMPFVIPLQLFSYYMATRKGYDPDKPRNLAKSVTVL
ncbi:MAG: glutamine--fructose-6-phosphate transaminase (isomerizing) [Candidatus Thorarchaeota archaeon]|nr:glutamine--fructose-6-phosphate transaminase (isomerizing) [Candidatus Thorarchaeota archaeon]